MGLALPATIALTSLVTAACGSGASSATVGNGTDSGFAVPDASIDSSLASGDASGGGKGSGKHDATSSLGTNDGGSGVKGCIPKSCKELGVDCGDQGDGCGGLVKCGGCTAPETCGGDGKPSTCGGNNGCVPTTCEAEHENCGPIGNGCGGVLQCGTCDGNRPLRRHGVSRGVRDSGRAGGCRQPLRP